MRQCQWAESFVAFGKGSMEDALEDIRRQGTTNVILHSMKPTEETASTNKRSWILPYGLTWEDYDRCKEIDAVVGIVPMRIFPWEVRRIDKAFQARLVQVG